MRAAASGAGAGGCRPARAHRADARALTAPRRRAPARAHRHQVRHKEMRTKVLGIQKLTYLYMLGYDISWASFNVIEGARDKTPTARRRARARRSAAAVRTRPRG